MASVQALNRLTRDVESSYNYYAATFDPDRGPTGRESSASLRLIEGSAVADAVAVVRASLDQASGELVPGTGYAEAREMYTRLRWTHPAPVLPLAVALQRHADAIARLLQLQAEAAPYYKQESFRDDRFAGAKAMHPGLVSAYREVLNASEALTQAVLLQAPYERERFLGGLPSDDRLLAAAVLRNVTQGRRLLGFIAAALDTNLDGRTLDLPRLQQEIVVFEQSVGDIRSFVGVNSAGTAFSIRNHRITSYLESAEKLLGSAKYLWRGLRDRRPPSGHEFDFRSGSEFDIFARFDDLTAYANLIVARR